MLAHALCPDRQRFAFQSASIGGHRLLADILQGLQGVNVDFLDRGNAGNAQQLIEHRAVQSPAVGHVDIHAIPTTLYPNVFINTLQQFADILAQLTHLLLTNGFAFNGHFRGGANQDFHGSAFCRMAYGMGNL